MLEPAFQRRAGGQSGESGRRQVLVHAGHRYVLELRYFQQVNDDDERFAWAAKE